MKGKQSAILLLFVVMIVLVVIVSVNSSLTRADNANIYGNGYSFEAESTGGFGRFLSEATAIITKLLLPTP